MDYSLAMDNKVDIVGLITTLLDSGKYKEALSVPNNEKLENSFKGSCLDMIPVIIGKIADDTMIIKPSLHGICEELLAVIVQKSTAEEALLEFIEQIEIAKNDAQFSIILMPLQQLLIKLSAKRGHSLEWCLNSISTYIETIPTPEYKVEGKDSILMDCDTNVRRITRVYSLLPHFYEPFIKELLDSSGNIKTKQIITAFLISLLGKPLIYIDMDPETNGQSEARQCCTSILQDICALEKDIYKFLFYVDVCYKQSLKSKSNSSQDSHELLPYEHREKINLTTLSVLMYAVFSKHFPIPNNALPQVYSIEYLVHIAMLCVNHLLSFTEYGPLAKGLSLFKALLNHLPEKTSHVLLLSSVHFDVSKSLMNVAIYLNFATIRQNAVSLVGSHVNKFNYKGRCLLIKYLLKVANHSGMIGYAITLYKRSIDEAFKEQVFPDCFTGAQLMNMIKIICHLPHGVESDLVELADQIISALNILRYLVIRDTENVTGIRECFSYIENDYLEKLRTGLNMSKAHYEVKLKDLQDEKKQPGRGIEISINVGGNVLDNIPSEKKQEIINSALNAFHLVEGLVGRLSECINVHKMKALNKGCLN